MQISRKQLGKLKELSIYNPFDLFNFKDAESTKKAITDLMSQISIYGRLFINGTNGKDMNPEQIDMFTYFLKESQVLHTIYKFQNFSEQSLEYIANLYEIVKP